MALNQLQISIFFFLSDSRFSVFGTVGELEEAHADLEACQRQLAALRSQDVKATPTGKSFEVGNGGVARESFSKKNFHLEAGLEEAKVPFQLNFLSLARWCNVGFVNYLRFVSLVSGSASFLVNLQLL